MIFVARQKFAIRQLSKLGATLLFCVLSWLQNSAGAQTETVQQVMQASEDARMYDQMNRISQWINYTTTVNHRFPEYGDEMKDAKEQLNQLIPNPPYKPRSMRLAPGLDADTLFAQPEHASVPGVEDPYTGTSLDRINISIDLSLTELEIQGWRTDPPDEWQAAPGTISIISNQQSVWVIWGAGADGLPLRDQYNKRVLMIIGRYHGLYDTQE